jgi:hypothetical protein
MPVEDSTAARREKLTAQMVLAIPPEEPLSECVSPPPFCAHDEDDDDDALTLAFSLDEGEEEEACR